MSVEDPRALVLGISLILVFIILVVVICVTCRCCPCYSSRCCRKKETASLPLLSDTSEEEIRSYKENGATHLLPNHTQSTDPLPDVLTSFPGVLPNSTYARSGLDDPYNKNSSPGDDPGLGDPAYKTIGNQTDVEYTMSQFKRGEVYFTIAWDPNLKCVVIKLMQARKLTYTTQIPPKKVAIKLQFLKGKYRYMSFSKRRSLVKYKEMSKRVAFEIQSTFKKDVINPTFNEMFTASIPEGRVHSYSLRVFTCAFDQFNKSKEQVPDVHGECVIAMADFDLSKECHLCETLQAPFQEAKGQITVGVCYMATVERLQVSIESIVDLKVIGSKEASVYIKVSVIHKRDVITKQRTDFHKIGRNIFLAESIFFDVPPDKINDINLLITLKHVSPPEIEGEREKLGTVGKVIIGNAGIGSAQAQWVDMCKAPREMITAQHLLR